MNKRNVGIIILITLLLGLIILLFIFIKDRGLETKIDNYTYLIIKENKEVDKVKVYDDYYDVYLCGVDANIVIDGKTMSLKEAFDKKLIDPDEIVFGISIHWRQIDSLDDGGTEIFSKGKYEVTKYHRMIPNEVPWRSAVDYYEDLFIGTKDCKFEIEY